MNQEKIYKAMKQGGMINMVLGIISVITGITTGVLMIISGARLLMEKKNVII